jgi:hypothetical protein
MHPGLFTQEPGLSAPLGLCLIPLSSDPGHGPASRPAGGLHLPGCGACCTSGGFWAGAGAGGGGPDDG